MSHTLFKFENAKNGVIVEITPSEFPEETERLVYQEPECAEDKQEKEAWQGFLYNLTEHYGPQYNKWGKDEIRIDIRPGRKCDFKDDLTWFLKDCYYNPAEEKIEAAYEALEKIFNDQ